MVWIEKREIKYEEDKAYLLFGIFDVYIPVIYGEGREKAFSRLREKIAQDYRRLVELRSVDPRLEKERIEAAKGGLVTDTYRRVLETLNFD